MSNVLHLRKLYGASAAAQAATLPDVGDALAGALVTLSRDPEPSRCELLAIQLDGARQAVLRLRESLLSELGPDAA